MRPRPLLDKGVCKIARLPRQSILARLQSFRENTRKTKRHTLHSKIATSEHFSTPAKRQYIKDKKTHTARLPHQSIFARLQSLLFREKDKKYIKDKKGMCKVARLPHQSILARLQSFRENSTKTKKTYTARLPRQGIFASLPAKSSVKRKEKKRKKYRQ